MNTQASWMPSRRGAIGVLIGLSVSLCAPFAWAQDDLLLSRRRP